MLVWVFVCIAFLAFDFHSLIEWQRQQKQANTFELLASTHTDTYTHICVYTNCSGAKLKCHMVQKICNKFMGVTHTQTHSNAGLYTCRDTLT